MKKVIALISALMICLSLGACAGENADTTSPKAEGKTKKIGVSVLYRRDEYYTDLCTALQLAADEAGYEIEIMDADLDPAVQAQQIEDFVTAGVDAICLSPLDPDGLVQVCDTVGESGIPVFVFDGEVKSDAVISNIKFDFQQNGTILGDWVAKYVEENFDENETVQLAVVDYPPSTTVCVPVCNAFLERVKQIPNVEVVTVQNGKATRADSMTAAENILTAYPDVDIMMGVNYDTVAGIQAALVAAGSDCIAVGAGWAQEGFQLLEENDKNLKVLSINPPAVQGTDTMNAIRDYFDGKELPKVYESTPIIHDANTISTYDWRDIVEMRK